MTPEVTIKLDRNTVGSSDEVFYCYGIGMIGVSS